MISHIIGRVDCEFCELRRQAFLQINIYVDIDIESLKVPQIP